MLQKTPAICVRCRIVQVSKKVSGVACFGHLAIDKAHLALLLGRTRYPLVVAWRNSLSIWNEVV